MNVYLILFLFFLTWGGFAAYGLKKKKWSKIISIGGGFIVAIIVIPLAASPFIRASKKTHPLPTRASDEPSAYTKVQKEIVLEFEKSFYASSSSADLANKKIKETLQKVAAGQANVYSSFRAAKAAQIQCEEAQQKYTELPVPSGLPYKSRALLEKASKYMAAAYRVKAESFVSLQSFLDDKKPSQLQKFKDDSKLAESLVLAGVAKLLTVKSEAGLIDSQKSE